MARRENKDRQRELDQIRAREASLRREMMIDEDFTTGKFTNIMDPNVVLKNKDRYPNPETTVIHEDSGVVFDISCFTPKEVEGFFFNIESMLYQIKYVTKGKLDDKKEEEVVNMLEQCEALKSNLVPYYNSMVKVMGKKNNNNKNTSRKIGGIGINSGMFH